MPPKVLIGRAATGVVWVEVGEAKSPNIPVGNSVPLAICLALDPAWRSSFLLRARRMIQVEVYVAEVVVRAVENP